MADEAPETTAPVTEPNPPAPVVEDDEPRIPRERLNQEAAKRKEAEKQLAELRRKVETLEASGLSETEQERKARERAELERDELRTERDELSRSMARSRAEGWVTAAANAAGFEDAEDAVLRVTLDDVESAEDAERAVKRLAKAKPRLLKAETPTIPGRVLQDGRAPDPAARNGQPAGIDRNAEADTVAAALQEFLKRSNAGRIA